MRLLKQRLGNRVIVLLAVWMTPICAWAGYVVDGYDLGPVKSGSGLANAASLVQTNPLFSLSGASKSYTVVTTTFTGTACQSVNYARLFLDVYGSTPYYSAQLTASLNGTALPTLTIGGTGQPSPGIPGDGNPANRDPNAACVYGSGFGYWQIALGDVSSLLKTDGSNNTLVFQVTDPTSNFDGRAYGATLVSIYTNPAIQQSLDYQLFEGDGYMRQTASTTAPYPKQNLSRSLAVTGVNTANMASAAYIAGYATGHTAQNDQIYFNGTALGPTAGLGNNIARIDSNTELHSFDVTSLIQGSNTVNYSIDQSVLGSPGESSVHADWALLTVAHPVPEPSALALLAVCALASITWARKRI
jgi:hypothetical protein